MEFEKRQTKTAASQAPLEISPDLRAQFQRLERRLWWVDSSVAVCGAASSLLVSYLVLFLSDRFWNTAGTLRLLLSAAGWGGALYFAWGWLKHWIWRPRDLRALANVVQRHYRRLGDRLLGIVELADPRCRPGNVSTELCRAAIRQVSAEALSLDFRQAVATRKPRLYALASLWIVVVVIGPWMLVPEASRNAFARWIWPGATVPRYTFIRLEEVPSPLVVAHGEPFEIACSVQWHRLWQPRIASCRVADQAPFRVSVVGNRVVFPIPGQTKPSELTLKLGDVTRQVKVNPVLRPALKSLSAKIQWPAYLQHPDTEQNIPKGAVSFLEGSQVAFHGQVTRTLTTVAMRWDTGQNSDLQSRDIEVKTEGDFFSTKWLPVPGPARAAFVWRDEWGLTSAAPWILTLQSHADQPPAVECPDQASAVAILEEEILDVKAVAQDDYGLRDLAMAWECRRRQETNLLASDVASVSIGSPLANNLEGTFRFSPALLNLPADTVVTLCAVAHDYYPDRAPSESAAYRVFILSREEHARLIQQELERLMAELEDITRRQGDVKEAGGELQRAGPETLASNEAAQRLSNQAREQEALSDKLRQLSERASATIREALRNKSIPTSLLEEWARHAEAMRHLASQFMPQAARALATARQNASDRQAALEEALELEEEILRGLLELQKEIGPALDRFLANTLAQRLRRVAQTEAQISKALQSMLPKTIGFMASQLPESQRLTIQALGGQQNQARQESRQLHQEISRFFDRTSETNYGTVTREMQDKQVVQALADLAGLIQDNVAALAMKQTHLWQEQFGAWADLLDQADLGGGGGSAGGGGGSLSEAALRRLLALLRLRQQEQNIREFTGILQERKKSSRSYREDGILLSIRQNYLVQDTEELEAAGPSRFLPQTRQAMSEAEKLLMVPRTDEPVLAAETDAVNLLEAEIMDMLKSAQGSPIAAAMAMLMQMMGMGSSPGGSFAGGNTDQPNENLTGEIRGSPGEERGGEKTVGPSTRVVPAEFRDALQNYHRALEQLEASREN